MKTIEFANSLIEILNSEVPYVRPSEPLFSNFDSPSYNPNRCFVWYSHHQGRGFIRDAMYGSVGGYTDETRPECQCDDGGPSGMGLYYQENLFSYYGEFHICRNHAGFLPETLKPPDLQNERIANEHQEIENRIWDSIGWDLVNEIEVEFEAALLRGERMK